MIQLIDTISNVEVASYVSEEYRTMEKVISENIATRNNLLEQISSEMSKIESERDTGLIASLTEQANNLADKCAEIDYLISSEVIALPFDNTSELTFKNIYDQLKALNKFSGATDI